MNEDVVDGCIAGVFLFTVQSLLGTWVFMLAVGTIHHDWLPNVPAIEFGACYGIFVFLMCIQRLLEWRIRE